MNATVHQLKPADTLALFYSIDGSPRFGVKLCDPSRLAAMIESVMYFSEGPGEQKAICADMATELREKGSISFEDGWLTLTVGLADTVAFLMDKIKNAEADESYADTERAKQHRRADEVETKYAALCALLREALGENEAVKGAAKAA